jgi:hypothetical protein
MEELIFFAVIIFFSIIESIARSRKKQSGGQPQIPADWEPEEQQREWRPERSAERPAEPPRETRTVTYDSSPSHDDLATREAADARQSLDASRGSGSEGMIPADIWDEIAGLTRERMRQLEPQPPAPLPAPLPPATPSGRAAWGKRTPRVGQQHRVHLSHAGYGTDPSSRAASAHDGMDPLAQKLSADVRTVRKQLRHGRHALRQAVILQEVLGEPASLRPEAFRD